MSTLTFELNTVQASTPEKSTKQIKMAAVKRKMQADSPDLSLSLIEPEMTNAHRQLHHHPKRRTHAAKYLTEMTKHELQQNKNGQSMKLIPYLFRCSATQIRVFHITWITFFVCFFSWFSVTNLDKWITPDLGLTQRDKSVAKGLQAFSTIIFRIVFGDFCDKIGARYSYIILLIISFISLACFAFFTYDSISYIIFSVISGIIGASFVITEYHVTCFYSSSCVGAANALAAGWGNFGGGVAMALTPLICNFLIEILDISPNNAWRFTLLFPCILLFIMIFVYYLYTLDTPKGNISKEHITAKIWCTFNKYKWKRILCDYRVWLLSLAYAMCFGIEITILNYSVDYFVYQFDQSPENAGWVVFGFSFLNLFARGFGGYLSDILSTKYGLQGKVYCLFMVLIFEALFLGLFAWSSYHFGYSVLMLLFFSCYVQIAEGIVFAIVPVLPHKKYMGLCIGIIGAGGNLGPFVFSLTIFKNVPHEMSYVWAWITCGICVFVLSFTVLLVRFTQKEIELDLKLTQMDFFTSMENSKSDHKKGKSASTKNVGFVIH